MEKQAKELDVKELAEVAGGARRPTDRELAQNRRIAIR